MKYIITCEKARPEDFSQLGGKAAALAKLGGYGLPVPDWFAVKTNAYYKRGETPPEGFMQELEQALAAFPDDTRFAVRSSAMVEDGAEASFAGQFESYLWVLRDDVAAKIHEVWDSAFSSRVSAYCRNNNIAAPTEPPVALVQQMVAARKAGVAFAANPINADTQHGVVSAIFGLGSALVNGATDADTYAYNYRTGVVRAAVAEKSLTAEPLNREIIPELIVENAVNRRVLSDSEVAEVAMLVKRTSYLQGRLQDIEWAYDNKRLYLLQSRPITTLHSVFEANARPFVFDSSNIAESYSQTTTPLTFTFIRLAYSGVYEQFCRVFGVSEKIIADNMGVFARMLAFVDNRVYYNLYSWYKMLSFLPGYSLNRAFMEQMMGVREPLPDEFLKEIRETAPTSGKLGDRASLVRCIFRLLSNYRNLEKHIKHFYKRLSVLLDTAQPRDLDVNELADAFAALEKGLLKRWDAPIENDFFAMIFHGILRSLCKKYKLPEELHSRLLVGQGGIISARPAEELREIGTMISNQPQIIELLSGGTMLEISRMLEGNDPLREKTAAYLNMFGDRCVDELKLESAALTTDPLPFYRAVAAMAAAGDTAKSQTSPEWCSYVKNPFRRALFAWVLKNTRRLVKNRENMRFERTRLFGRMREIALCFGMHYSSRGIISEARDIFFLTMEEMLGALDNTAAGSDFRGLVEVRKAEYLRNFEKSPPTRVYVNGVSGFSARKKATEETVSGDGLSGLACCAGVVEGTARIVTDPRNTDFARGQILVAHSTDPGWVVLFSLAAGIIVERGSLLSHAAIVSREMGIPCIVSAPGAMSTIPNGATVRMDGATGKIVIVGGGENG